QFTALFEVLAIDWLKQASVSAVAKHLRITWDEASGIMERAVRRGLERREAEPMKYVGLDETSFAKRHEYVTLVPDLTPARGRHAGTSSSGTRGRSAASSRRSSAWRGR